MKKWLLIFVFLGLLFWSWVALRLTHTLEYYAVSSDANLPTLKQGNIFFASRLKEPRFGNFVCFKLPDKKFAWTFRCIGMPGDIIEIKNTKVYRNGALLYEPYTYNEYLITQSQINRIAGYVHQNKNKIDTIRDTVYKITLTQTELKGYHLHLSPVASAKGMVNDDVFVDFKKAGNNEDNLGPVKVPPGNYFLLGDSRHDAFDSRYIGFIKKENIVSTVLGNYSK